MKRYMALLRGINISGKNKVVMAELKKEFESLKFEDVKTYLNSGNVIFLSRENIEKITKQIEEMLKKNYDFKIPVFVLEIGKSYIMYSLDFDEKVEKYDQHIVLYVDDAFVRPRFRYPHYQYEENILRKRNLNKKELKDSIQKYGDPDDYY